ncbi:MAG: AMP-binding protein, partial [candidate division Zixibacteria bacterium]
GTTGTPKLAIHSHSNETIDTWLAGTLRSVNPGDHVLIGLPLFHANAALGSLGVITRGGGVVLATPDGYRDPDVLRCFLGILRTYSIKWFSAVPTILSRLLKLFEEPVTDLPVDFVAGCAAPVSTELASSFQSRFGIKALEVYGLTEATALCSMCPQHAKSNIGSIGIRLPYVNMRPAKIDSSGHFDRFCEAGEVGTLVVRGPTVFKGYVHEWHNNNVWVEDLEGKRWLNTGDLGKLDESGYFWLVGRAKDLIIRGGHNIDPKIIEEVFYAHPSVSLVAAVPRPDEDLGEVPVVYVTVSPPGAIGEAELLRFAADNSPERSAMPKAVIIIEEMPVTAVGKIFKPELVDREIVQVAKSILAATTTASNQKVSIDCVRSPKGTRVIHVRGDFDIEQQRVIEKDLAFLQTELDIKVWNRPHKVL